MSQWLWIYLEAVEIDCSRTMTKSRSLASDPYAPPSSHLNMNQFSDVFVYISSYAFVAE